MSATAASGRDPVVRLFGVLARFHGPAELLVAAGRLHDLGYRQLDAYSPFPVHGMDKALGLGRSKVPVAVLAGLVR